MAVLDREMFIPAEDGGGLKGEFSAVGRTFSGSIRSWHGQPERAWENAERIFTFVLNRFHEIEEMARRDLVPNLELWVDEDDGLTPDEVERIVLHLMRESSPVGFTIYDTGASSLYFDGPDFVEGHSIEVQFDGDGALVTVGLAG